MLDLTDMPEDLLVESTFSNLKKLKHLSLSSTNLCNGLAFLEGKSLESLWVMYCRKVSLIGLQNLRLLKELAIESYKNIEGFEEIFALKSLRTVKLVDSSEIEGGHNFCSMDMLETLIVLGSSKFKDGNLDPAKNKFKIFNFDNKRHYSINPDEFNEKYLVREND